MASGNTFQPGVTLALRLMDTNVASFILKGHSLAHRYRRHLQGHQLAVSFMTEGELFEWGFSARWSKSRFAQLEDLLDGLDIIPSSADVDRRWGAVRFERRQQPIGGCRCLGRCDCTCAWLRASHSQSRGFPGNPWPHGYYGGSMISDD